ncbi:MAG: adenine deaminase [Proteobacteria bacterium]|nr:adenine deaminase [Pseudomonadota bacterium]
MKDNGLKKLLAVARGDAPGDLLLKGGRIVEVFSGKVIPADVLIFQGRIAGVGRYDQKAKKVIELKGKFVLPGFIDGHIHIESSLLGLSEFARLAIRSGTTAVIADPHEIANVLGIRGIDYLIRASRGLPVDIFFTVPSCVPATAMETAGAKLGPREIARLLKRERVVGLAEMMNFPGVICGDPLVLEKIRAARSVGKIVDGHAPGLTGKGLSAYVAAGVKSDHECTKIEEAREKLRSGMMIMIREGSAAKNLKDLLELVDSGNAHRFMLVSDDRDAGDMWDEGDLNAVLARAVKRGLDPITAVRMVTINPANYFGLNDRGAIVPGYRADLVVTGDLKKFVPGLVFKDGVLAAEHGKVRAKLAAYRDPRVRGTVRIGKIDERSFRIPDRGKKVKVIGVIPDQIVTRSLLARPRVVNGEIVSDSSRDLLKLAVIERHGKGGGMGLGLVRGFGIKRGALASTVAHDSHNLIAVGVEDRDLALAVSALKKQGGGYVVAAGGKIRASLPLPVAGLLSEARAGEIIRGMKKLNQAARDLGSTLPRPFSTLSFLALPVIPELKLTDRGLVDVGKFQIISLYE